MLNSFTGVKPVHKVLTKFFSNITTTENNTIAIEAQIELANIKTLIREKISRLRIYRRNLRG